MLLANLKRLISVLIFFIHASELWPFVGIMGERDGCIKTLLTSCFRTVGYGDASASHARNEGNTYFIIRGDFEHYNGRK